MNTEWGEVNGIQKNIGGVIETYNFDGIKEIEIQSHMTQIFFSNNNSGSATYLITMKQEVEKDEQFVVSAESIDKPQVNLIDCFNNIKKITGENFTVTEKK